MEVIISICINGEFSMKLFHLILVLVFSLPLYSENLSVIANSDMRKGEQIDVPQLMDGDLETSWSETFNKKMQIFIVLSQAETINSLGIIWGDEFAEEIELELKTRGGWKGPEKIKGKQNAKASYFDMDKKRSSKYIRITLKTDKGPKLITIKELKINGETSILSAVKSDVPNKTVETEIEEPKPAQAIKPKDESKNELDSDKEQDSPEQPIQIEKVRKKVFI
ncbi:discoidin domain-containing protein [Lentisphaera profundi]|uniref:Discoidin domain-containing protein n=1 Tax=Lentisphaera profundi TaxID=1658616 RepID=A0ABY7W383_9BACT|nr:discoidin domain-containing protein [Lentisphaera profundi]WDE99444.1 discoidin domain-containing protein [Lentisphaera profundi]